MGISREEIQVKLGVDNTAIKAGSAQLGQLGEEAGHFFSHGLARSLRRGFHILTIGGALREIVQLSKEYESLKDNVEELEKVFGHLSESQKTALDSLGKSVEQTQKGLKQIVSYVLGGISDFFEITATQLRGIDAESIFRDRAEAAKEAENEIRDLEREHFREWFKEHVTRKNMTEEELVSYLSAKRAQAFKDAENSESRPKKQTEFLQQAFILQNEIDDILKKQTKEKEKQLETTNKIAEAEGKRAFHEYSAWQSAIAHQKELIRHSEAAVIQGVKDPFMFTLQDLAQDDTRWGAQARQANQLREWAKWNIRHGQFALAGEQARKAQDIQDAIRKENPFLRDPLAELQDEAKLQNQKLQEIITDGLQIKAAD